MPPPDQPTPSETKSLSDLFALADKYIAPSEGRGMSTLATAANFVINDSGNKYNKKDFEAAVSGLKDTLEGRLKEKPEDWHAFQDIKNNLDMTITAKDRLTGIDRMLDMILSPTDRKDQRDKYQTAYKTLFPGEEDVLKVKVKDSHGSGSKAIDSYNPTALIGDSVFGFNESGMCGDQGYITNMITMLNKELDKEQAVWHENPDNRKLFQKIVLKSQAMGFNPMTIPKSIPNLDGSLKTIVTKCAQSMQTEATPEQQIQLCEQVLTSLKQNAPDHVMSKIKDAYEKLIDIKRNVETGQQVSAKDILTLQEKTSIAVYNTLNQNNYWQLPSSRGISPQKADTGNHSTKFDADNQKATPLDAHNKDLEKFLNAQATLGEQTPEDSIFSLIIGQSQEVIDYNKKLSDHSKDLHNYLQNKDLHNYLKTNSAKIVSKPPFTTTAHNERSSNCLKDQACTVCYCKDLRKNSRLD